MYLVLVGHGSIGSRYKKELFSNFDISKEKILIVEKNELIIEESIFREFYLLQNHKRN